MTGIVSSVFQEKESKATHGLAHAHDHDGVVLLHDEVAQRLLVLSLQRKGHWRRRHRVHGGSLGGPRALAASEADGFLGGRLEVGKALDLGDGGLLELLG